MAKARTMQAFYDPWEDTKRIKNKFIRRLYQTGHLEYPFGNRQTLTKSVTSLKISDPEVVKAIASYQDFEAVNLDQLSLLANGRPAHHDGDVGPATETILTMDRCGHPDYGPDVQSAVGTGGWKRCHDVGEFHCAKVYIDESGMPSFLKPVFGQVWDNTVKAYAEIGLLLLRVNNKSEADITASFVRSSSGWIGLAIVGPGDCKGRSIWQQYLATYNPSNTVREWSTLWMHETGHNVGLSHSRGGIMNPSIVQGLRASWIGDTSEALMKRMYGGVQVPIGPGPGPDPVPPPAKGQLSVSVIGDDGTYYVGLLSKSDYRF